MAATNQHAVVIPTPHTNATAAGEGLRDIRGPVPLPSELIWLWITLGVLAAVALFAWRKWFRSVPQARPVPIIPPHQRAKHRLADAFALLTQPKPFCTAVSDALRLYLEERFEFRAPERTTEEFLIDLQRTDLLNDSQKTFLTDFLTRCDLAKFAKHEPSEAELRSLHSAALNLVEETAYDLPVGNRQEAGA